MILFASVRRSAEEVRMAVHSRQWIWAFDLPPEAL